jgi:hypothetical protein
MQELLLENETLTVFRTNGSFGMRIGAAPRDAETVETLTKRRGEIQITTQTQAVTGFNPRRGMSIAAPAV